MFVASASRKAEAASYDLAKFLAADANTPPKSGSTEKSVAKVSRSRKKAQSAT